MLSGMFEMAFDLSERRFSCDISPNLSRSLGISVCSVLSTLFTKYTVPGVYKT